MPTNNYTATNSNGVKYALTYIPGAVPPLTGSYTLVITPPAGGGSPQTITGISPNNVLTSSGGSLSILSAVGTYYYVIPPGVSGTVNITASLLSTNVVDVGGTATISSTISALSGLTVNVDGGTATAAGGDLLGALSGLTVNLDNGGTFGNGPALISALNGTSINFGSNGGTFVATGGGALIDLSSTTINGFNTAKDFIQFNDTSAPIATYTITTSGSSETINAYASNGSEIATVTVAGHNFTAGSYSASGAGPLTATDNGSTLTIEPLASVCFLPGTLIQMDTGNVTVESVRLGDHVMAYANGESMLREVVWVGSKRLDVRAGLPDDESGYPVRILKDAIEDGVPYKDMLVTPEHCLFFNGNLIPVRMLVNNRSIFYDRSITSYDYYHIETEQHSIIVADGVLTESYLDTGNRRSFRDAGDASGTVIGAFRRPKTWEDDAAAPLMVARDTVEPIWRRLVERADKLSTRAVVPAIELVNDPDLHLVTKSGTEIRPAITDGKYYAFVIPGNATELRLVSRSSRPSDTIGPYVDDRRQLGVLVGRIGLSRDRNRMSIEKHLTVETLAGWHGLEIGSFGRWTDGNAVLPLDISALEGRPACLDMDIIQAGPYLVDSPATAYPVEPSASLAA